LAAENTKLKNKVQASTRPTGAPKEEENEEFTVNGVKWYYCGKYWSGIRMIIIPLLSQLLFTAIITQLSPPCPSYTWYGQPTPCPSLVWFYPLFIRLWNYGMYPKLSRYRAHKGSTRSYGIFLPKSFDTG